MSKHKSTGQGSICWRCRRSDADLAANPKGYCSWLAEGRLPVGTISAPAQKYYGQLRVVVYCPEYEDEVTERM